MTRTPPATETTTSYFIQSRPTPDAPWQQHGLRFSWRCKAKALEKLAGRREMAPDWEHRLMTRTTTVVEEPTPAAEMGEACAKCKTPFDPADTRFDGAARYSNTPYCGRCVDRCHESTDAFHRCVICDSYEAGE